MSEAEERPAARSDADDTVAAAANGVPSERSDAVRESNPVRPKGSQPSLVPGVVLLAVAAVLIVIVLINPSMPGWARTTVAIVAICVVLALLGYVVYIFRATTRRGSGR